MTTAEEQLAHRRLWISRLRDGSFSQGKGCLREQDSLSDLYCCLGVACEIYRIETGLGEWQPQSIRDKFRYAYNFVTNEGQSPTALPKPVTEWFGLRTPSGLCNLEDTEWSSLSGANDHRTPFSIIADIIEAEPEGLLDDTPEGG